MPKRQIAIDEYARAVVLEQAAWAAVRHHLPGSAEFDRELWLQWRESIVRADQAAEQANIATRLCAEQSAAHRPWPRVMRFPALFRRQQLDRSPGP
jgi:hypothetical protein